MRPDMSKVIVERPRRGSRLPNRKSALSLNPTRLDDEMYIDPPKPKRPVEEKELNENLAPLRRYLEANEGRPWTKVYAEIRATLDGRKATGLHILQHLMDFVDVNTWMEGRTILPGGGRFFGRARAVTRLYVPPPPGPLPVAPPAPLPRHAHVHVEGWAMPVDIFGMTVVHGDLIHADRHGAVVIPHELAAKLPPAIDLLARKEKVILDAAKKKGFGIEVLRQAFAASEDIH